MPRQKFPITKEQLNYIIENRDVMSQAMIARVLNIRPDHVRKVLISENLSQSVNFNGGYNPKKASSYREEFFNVFERENWLV